MPNSDNVALKAFPSSLNALAEDVREAGRIDAYNRSPMKVSKTSRVISMDPMVLGLDVSSKKVLDCPSKSESLWTNPMKK